MLFKHVTGVNPMPETLTDDWLQHQWHSLTIQETIQKLDSNLEKGLTEAVAITRHQKWGPNQLTRKRGKSAWLRFLLQFNQPLLYILLAAGVVKLFLHNWITAGVIFAVMLLNATISFIQESKAESAIAVLSKIVTTEATVIRHGETLRVPSPELVPGDVVRLSCGDKVPADLRLLQVSNLQIDESTLTGESLTIAKQIAPLDADTPLAERTNMAYAGSFVTFGQGCGVVTAIGDTTETGQIASMLGQSSHFSTPLTRKFAKFSHKLLYIILALSALTFAVGLGQGHPWIEVFDAAVALAVSAIPEGLPAIVTITLAIGVARMSRRHAIIRKLPAVEALGSTTVICTDKTGTLTKNQMTVQSIWAGNQLYSLTGEGYTPQGEILLEGRPVNLDNYIALQECLRAGVLCNDAHLQVKRDQHDIVGDPTEGALIVAAQKAGLFKLELEQSMPRQDAIPFDSQFHYMATLHDDSCEEACSRSIYVKGAVEVLLPRCHVMLTAQGNLEDLDAKAIEQVVHQMAEVGLRVLAFAKKPVVAEHCNLNHEDIETELIFLGLQGMMDPPRPEAIAAVNTCHTAGIQVKMITGDHKVTAVAIARMMAIPKNRQILAFSGQELAQMDFAELAQAVEQGSVFARVAPEQKLLLVEALQTKGEIVAMTGDGVNDAPALKQADIGIAMALSGTEVAKEAADMLLTDDNFASIEAAVEEGRTVYLNLLKATAFILPVNGGEAMTVLMGILLGTTLPILPVQILWLNMVSSVALTVPLAFEPRLKQVMKRAPRNPRESLLSGSVLRRVITISLCNWVITFGLFEWALQTTGDENLARTMAVHGLAAAEAFYLLGISQFIPSVMARLNHQSHQAVAYVAGVGIMAVILLQGLFSQWELMNQLFRTVPLTLIQGLICIAVGLPVILVGVLFRQFDPIV